MNINVLNVRYERIAILDTYVSLIWCKRYNDIGALDLVVEANARNFDILRRGNFITRDDDDAVYRIDAIEIDTSNDENNQLIIGAYDCKNILSQRIIWKQINFNGTVENYIRRIIDENFITPQQSGRKINNFALKSTKGFAETIIAQSQFENVAEKIIDLCTANGYGWRVTLENGIFYFDLYKGVDRSAEQDVVPRVVFSPDYDNIISTKYNVNGANYKNVALVAGEGEGTERKTRSIGNGSGINRYEVFIESNVSSNDGGDLVDYYEALIADGKEQLAEMATVTTFEGEVDSQSYVYKSDFNLGDIVTVENEYGIKATARIVEITESWNEEGYTLIPIFDYLEITEESEINGAILTENNTMIVSENGTPLIVETTQTDGGIKISELTPVTELHSDCSFPVVQGGVTRRITKSVLQSQMLPTFEIDENGDLIAILDDEVEDDNSN